MSTYVQRQITGFLGLGSGTTANLYAPEQNLWSLQDVPPSTILKLQDGKQLSGVVSIAASTSVQLPLPQEYLSANKLYCLITTDGIVKATVVSTIHATSDVMVACISAGGTARGVLSFVDRVTSIMLNNATAVAVTARYCLYEYPDLALASSWQGGVETTGVVTTDQGDAEVAITYEEGSWTPVLSFTSGNGTASSTGSVGRFTRIGNRVFFNAVVDFTKGTAAGQLRVAGLPYAAEGTTNLYNAAAPTVTGLTPAANTLTFLAIQPPGTARLDFYTVSTNGGSLSSVSAGDFGAGAVEIIITGSYSVA